jgi:hypothetical protein
MIESISYVVLGHFYIFLFNFFGDLVIDFGGATFDDDTHKSTIINTRQYRGPEVHFHYSLLMLEAY